MGVFHNPPKNAHVVDMRLPYSAEVAKAWLARRVHLRQIRDNPVASKADRQRAIRELESGK